MTEGLFEQSTFICQPLGTTSHPSLWAHGLLKAFAMRRSSTDETPYRRSPSLDSKPDTPPFTSGFHRFSGEFEYKRPPFAFGFHTTKGPQTSKGRDAQGKKYVVFYLDLSFIFLLELRRCRMAEGCMMALRYGMVFFNLLFWVSLFMLVFLMCVCVCVFFPDLCGSLLLYLLSFFLSSLLCVCATTVTRGVSKPGWGG